MAIYSEDLRERVIAFIEEGGKKLDASRLFKVSRPAIDRWLLWKEDTGTLKTPPLAPRRWRKVDPVALQAYVDSHPDESLENYAQHFQVSPTGIWRAFKRLKMTRKKRQLFIKNETKANDQHF